MLKILKYSLSFISIIFSLFSCQQKEQLKVERPENQIVIGNLDSIHSNILDESRKLWIHIPESAKDSSYQKIKYPVLYLLDGPSHFKSVAGIIEQLSPASGNMIVPEMIIVGIENTNRSLDLTPSLVEIDFISGDSIPYPSGGGNKFLDFIEKELVPHIEKTYPASQYRTFIGHSFGGLSVINALVNRQSLFNNYVAIDPSLWWDNRAFLNVADSLLSENKFDKRALYVGVANTMEAGMNIEKVQNDSVPDSNFTVHIKSILQFVKSIEAKKDNGLLFKWKYYQNDDHGSVPLITEYDALRFLFSWYKMDGVNEFFSEKSTLTVQELLGLINSHFAKVSDKFGYLVLPPEQFINSIGYGFMNNDMLDKASSLFDLNIQNYPESSNVYDSRGDCFLAQQDSITALKYFTKAMEVGDNNFSQEKIDMLKENLNIE